MECEIDSAFAKRVLEKRADLDLEALRAHLLPTGQDDPEVEEGSWLSWLGP